MRPNWCFVLDCLIPAAWMNCQTEAWSMFLHESQRQEGFLLYPVSMELNHNVTISLSTNKFCIYCEKYSTRSHTLSWFQAIKNLYCFYFICFLYYSFWMSTLSVSFFAGRKLFWNISEKMNWPWDHSSFW